MRIIAVLSIAIALFGCVSEEKNSEVVAQAPDRSHFVSMSEYDPSILMDIRYFENHNFVGERIRGYQAPKCLLTKEAAAALVQVQKELLSKSYSLKIYDCYRPQKAVNHFVDWAKDLKDTRMKAEFYPRVDKTRLFADGYIAEKSGHSRGSTLDLTIVKLPVKKQPAFAKDTKLVDCTKSQKMRYPDNMIDMGTGFDCFDLLSHTANPKISALAKQNRELLTSTMAKFGFKNLAEEWWHYTLKDEPFPSTFFDIDVE